MAERDYIGRLLQILRIKSPVDSVSGDDIIAIETKMQYDTLFPITEDGDIIYKAYLESVVIGTTYFTDNSTTGIVCDKTAGTVTLADIATNFPLISANGIIRASIDVLIGGVWYANDVLPEVTKDGSGNLLTALFTLGNTGITTIRGRIY